MPIVFQNIIMRELHMTQRFVIIWLWIFIFGGTALTYFGKGVSIVESLVIGPIFGIVVGTSTGILINGILKYRHSEGKGIIVGWIGATVGCTWCLTSVFHWRSEGIAAGYMWDLAAVSSIAGAAGSLFFGTVIISILRSRQKSNVIEATYK